MTHPEPATTAGFEPRRPALLAGAIFVVAMLTLCLPMLGGSFLVGDLSDQYGAGYAFRNYAAAYWRQHHAVPLWNPYLFGGLPFVAAMHGDIFYPTAALRWFLPTDVAMTVGFAIHLVVAGVAMFALLRALRLSWTAAVVGGLGYELSGIIASLVHPGHDGKLFVSALAPFLFLALLRAIRHQRFSGYPLAALIVGLCLVSPHYQLTYYLLVAAGIWTLWLVFVDPERPPGMRWPLILTAALGAVVLGLAISAAQALPFLEYIPFSPRAVEGPSRGWDYATNFSLPIEELMTAVLPEFNGMIRNYWGRNPLKFHTEYIGAIVVLLAVLGAGDRERGRLRWIFGGIGVLFLLISFGRYTPFYRLWYELMPMMKSVRAPGMAWFLVAFVTCVFAAFGVERLLEGRVQGKTLWIPAGVLAVIALLGAVGAMRAVVETLAMPQHMEAAIANASALQGGAIRLLIVVAAGAAVLWAASQGRLRGAGAATALTLVVLADNWSIDRHFFVWSKPAQVLFADDAITRAIKAVGQPARVLDLGDLRGGFVYEQSTLMVYDIQQVLGYHGNEVRFYDELWGGKNVWANLVNPQLWDLWAVRFLLCAVPAQVPGYHVILGPVPTAQGRTGYLLERDTAVPYARVVAAAAKLPDSVAVPTVNDPRFPVSDVVVLSDTATATPAPIVGGQLPQRPGIKATVTAWEPGRMTITLEGASPNRTWLLVSEAWYKDWHATVDGKSTPVHRGDYAAMTLELPAGAKEVHLWFASPSHATGKVVSLVALLLTAGLLAAPRVRRRRADG